MYGKKTDLHALDDFKDKLVVRLMKEKIREVPETGKRVLTDFKYNGTHRSAVASALPDSLFNRSHGIRTSLKTSNRRKATAMATERRKRGKLT